MVVEAGPEAGSCGVQERFEDAVEPALMMEQEATNQEMTGPLEAGKQRDRLSPGASRREHNP